MSTHLGDERQVKEPVDQRKRASSCMQRQTPMGEVQTPDPGKAQNSETEGTSLQTWAQAEVRTRAGLRAEHGVVGPDL